MRALHRSSTVVPVVYANALEKNPKSSSLSDESDEEEGSGKLHFHNGGGSAGSHHRHISNVLMLVDAVGLALIGICTVFEGYQMWYEFYGTCYQYNILPLAAWYAGRAAQTFGLTLLVIDVCGSTVGYLEAGGMYLLTIGPIINALAAMCFYDVSDPYQLLNKKWICVEITELVGIILLDITCMKFNDRHAFTLLLTELAGYAVVAMAAVMDCDFATSGVKDNVDISSSTAHDFQPIIMGDESIRTLTFDSSNVMVSLARFVPGMGSVQTIHWVFNFWHALDVFGLMLLAVVAVGQYRLDTNASIMLNHSSTRSSKERGVYGASVDV